MHGWISLAEPEAAWTGAHVPIMLAPYLFKI